MAPETQPELRSDEGRVKPILKWAGGKSGLLAQLRPLFPAHFERYFEPFLGGGAVFFSLGFGGPTFLNDSNEEIVSLYEVARDAPRELQSALDRLRASYSEPFYYALRAANPTCKIERAARTVFLNKTGFNGLYRQNAKGEFNVPFGKRASCPALYDAANVELVSRALQRSTLFSLDFEEMMDKAGAGDFVYCDPPYEPLSRTSSFNAYQGGGFSQNDQRRLRDACLRAGKRGVRVVVSNSSAPFIRELYEGCDIRVVSAKRAINSKGDARGEIAELAILI